MSPIIRFLAAEPTLRSHRLDSNYSAFLNTAKRVFDYKFETYGTKEPLKVKDRILGGIRKAVDTIKSFFITQKTTNDLIQDADLMIAYKDLFPTAESLIHNPDGPVALTTIGYFL